MKLKTVLLRLGSEKLIKLIDDDIFKILRLRNKQLINQQNLTDIVLQINSERKLISESKTRELIIDALKEKEAYLFGKIFNVESKNIWEALKNINCKKQKNLDAFYQLFEIDLIEKINLKSPDDKINPIVISPSYSLFSHQIDVLNKINNLLEKPVKKALLHMPTGSGKTRTAINIICDFLKENPKSLTVWLAHTEELCQQAHDEFNKAWEIIGNKKTLSFKLFKNFRYDLEKISSGFVVMSLDYAYSLTKKDQRKFFDLARNTNFVVMDEAHMSIAKSYNRF